MTIVIVTGKASRQQTVRGAMILASVEDEPDIGRLMVESVGERALCSYTRQ